jgi:hypothetical protein
MSEEIVVSHHIAELKISEVKIVAEPVLKRQIDDLKKHYHKH